MSQAHEKLAKWGVEGFNNHEYLALESGYIEKFFPNYISAKTRLLENRDTTTDPTKKRYLNAIRIYTYSLFENTWFGYLVSYSEPQETRFRVNKKDVNFSNAYRTHLPSFSSAILNFGTCRDLFFILLKLYCFPALISDLKKLLDTKYSSVNAFENDLSKLSPDPVYLENGKIFYNRNTFRNFFAHKVRLLWWKNSKCGTEYYLTRKVYDDIQGKQSSDYIKHVESLFLNHIGYESSIETSACTELISAGEILKDAHDVIAIFLNRSFELLSLKLP
jgi:hypothetical protein